MILRILLGHYRRHPVQAGFLLAGIVMANVLLVGTQLINAQARSSYAEGERLLRSQVIGRLQARDIGQPLDERLYINLRRQGFHELAPLLRRFVRTRDGQRLELLGIDALSMPRAAAARVGSGSGAGFSGFAFAPHQLWVAPARMTQLGWQAGARVALNNGYELPPVVAAPGEALGHRLVLDIGALQVLTASAGELSAIVVFSTAPERLSALQAALPEDVAWVSAAEAPDTAQLTRSLHLNLAAMGLLSFVVGVFLVYNALAFSYADRRELIRKLRLAGVDNGILTIALLIELALFLAAGSLLGAWLGALLAARLLPGVGQTLAQLYGVYIAYPDGLVPSAMWLPLLMTGLGAMLCVLVPLRQTLRAPLLERWVAGWALRQVARRDLRACLAGGALLAGALLIGSVATATWQALAGMACLLLGVALCLPWMLRGSLAGLGLLASADKPRLTWLLADSRWLLGPASLALMALTLALVANSGLNIMIDSFRQATENWLNQRLAAQLYLRPGVNAEAMQSWLARRHPDVRLVQRHRLSLDRETPDGRPVRVEIIDLADTPRLLQSVTLLRAEAGADGAFERGEGIFVSERAWRLEGWHSGAGVRLCAGHEETRVLGVYPDYGNPLPQWMVPQPLFAACWPGQRPVSLFLMGDEAIDWTVVAAGLQAEFGWADEVVMHRHDLRRAGMLEFERTFLVTRALNTLTLLVAGIGVFCAISAIHHHRLGQQSLLASLGLTRGERALLLLGQWGLLGFLCVLVVWPFGAALAAYLARVLTPVAFGWSFPLVLEMGHYVTLAAVAMLCLLLAVTLPSLRLLRVSPARMLREQAV